MCGAHLLPILNDGQDARRLVSGALAVLSLQGLAADVLGVRGKALGRGMTPLRYDGRLLGLGVRELLWDRGSLGVPWEACPHHCTCWTSPLPTTFYNRASLAWEVWEPWGEPQVCLHRSWETLCVCSWISLWLACERSQPVPNETFLTFGGLEGGGFGCGTLPFWSDA